MARLTNCKKCGQPVSDDADVCPHCNAELIEKYTPEQDKKPCRVCGAILDRNKHRFERTEMTEHLVNGTTEYETESWFEHVPCPKCGEPKPFLSYKGFLLQIAIGIVGTAYSVTLFKDHPIWPIVLVLFFLRVIWGAIKKGV